MLSDLLDPTNLDQLKGEGDIKTLLMVLQSQSSIVSDSAVLLIEEENLLGEEPEKMTEAEFLQTKAVQKGEVSFGIESWLAIRKRLFFLPKIDATDTSVSLATLFGGCGPANNCHTGLAV